MSDKFDLIVIGGGPGGYVAAIRASQLGLKTALVEKSHLGGICLNWGCIPTKALLRSAEIFRTVKEASEFGVEVSNINIDLEKIVKRSREVSQKLSSGIGHLMKKHKIQVFNGHGSLNGKAGESHKILVRESSQKGATHIADLQAKNIIIATGARARQLPGLELDGKQIWSYREAMVPKTLPKSVIVVGSGAIGIEFASFYNSLGAKVNVVEIADRILPVEDAEISQIAEKSFIDQGLEINTSTTISNIKKLKNKIKVTLKTGDEERETEAEIIISAVGIVPNTENLGLEATSITFKKGHIETDRTCATKEPGIYAIGDVTAPPWLAHKASHEGVICAEAIAGLKPHGLDTNNIPGCTYCHPQIASLGLTQQQAEERGLPIRVGRFPFNANGKAIAMGEDNGLIKTIFHEKTGELLGAHMIGAEVTEMIQGFAIGKTLETTEEELMQTIFPHPTMSEMMHESVLNAFDKALHI